MSINENSSSSRKSLRRSLLFVPANSPSMILASQHFGADSIIFDLEDSVSLGEKDAARNLLVEALDTLQLPGIEKVVRINPFSSSWGRSDALSIVRTRADTVLLPKSDQSSLTELVHFLTDEEAKAERGKKELPPLGIIALVETPKGLEEVWSCARSPRVNGVFLGAEDLTSEMDMLRSKGGQEIFFARCQLVCAAKANNIDAIDTPYTDILDEKGLKEDLRTTRSLGFTGKACIHPCQIEIVHEALAPSAEEIERSRRIVETFERSICEGRGAITVDGKMVDAPIVKRARKMLVKGGIVQ